MNNENRTALIEELDQKALAIKKEIVTLAVHAGEGHCAPGLSMADIVTVLYFYQMKHDPKNPNLPDRDRFILSKGHGCLGQYCTLYHAGYFDLEKLQTFLEPNSGLGGHPTHGTCPGIEVSSGSLGHGFSMAVGMAMAAKMDKKTYNIYSLIGDGENNEGMVWEAALCAAQQKLDNLVLIVDRNGFQCDGFSKDILDLEPLDKKWESFGWSVKNCDGHDIASLIDVFDQVPFEVGKPSVIIAKTVKGKGVSFMENSAVWHYRAPKGEEIEQALSELENGCVAYR